eukprot:CAMPEP_0203754018 /NCGR_PEP_ID=MMETSP0098-20131031/7683_1 /ASSEMBLY_ACC=CAM_ASM_000208 /TAXON_ID=96639 /ORGANISM=" , Strain NY0313808BC1" /LENGTH=3488 /DNA_ID=CAMNT_0050644861 /DNA_START=131 /DNA_END=10594 /DNA_ORIENTATION=+
MAYFVKRAILNALSKYIETDFTLDINLFSSGNTVELENVELKRTAIPSSFPVKVVQGLLGRVVVAVPLFSLNSKPIKVYLEDVSIVLEMKEDNDVSREDLVARLKKKKHDTRRALEALFESMRGGGENNIFGEDEENNDNNADGAKEESSFPSLPGFVRNLVKNIKVHVGNIHIRLEQRLEDPTRCNGIGICLQSVELDNVSDDWRPGISSAAESIYKLIRLNRFGCYIDSDSPRAKLIVFRNDGSYDDLNASPLVSYHPHTWLLEPMSVSIRVFLKNCWPSKREKVFKPTISLFVYVSKIKIYLHGMFASNLRSMLEEYDTWKDKVNVKVEKMDALNSKDTMSRSEHEERCNEYKNLYIKIVRRIKSGNWSKRRKAKNLKRLAQHESYIALVDLEAIWTTVLEAETRPKHSEPLCSNVKTTMEVSAADSSSIGDSSMSTSSTYKQENLLHLLEISQIADARPGDQLSEEESDEEEDADRIDLNEIFRQTRFEPTFDLNLYADEIKCHVSLSKFSDNMCTVGVEFIAFRVNDHGIEDIQRRHGGLEPSLKMAPIVDKFTGPKPVVVRVLEARGLELDGYAYIKVSHSGTTQKTHKSYRTKSPIWNESFMFEEEYTTESENEDEEVRIDRGKQRRGTRIKFAVWVSRDARADKLLGEITLKVRWKDLDEKDLIDYWLDIPGKGGGSVRVSVEYFHPKFPVLARSKRMIPMQVKRWGRVSSIWTDLLLGKIWMNSRSSIDSNQRDYSGTEQSILETEKQARKNVEVHDIEIARLDPGTYLLFMVERDELWRRCMSKFDPSVRLSNSNKIRTHLLVQLPIVYILMSRWQIVFLLTRFNLAYLRDPVQRQRGGTTEMEDLLHPNDVSFESEDVCKWLHANSTSTAVLHDVPEEIDSDTENANETLGSCHMQTKKLLPYHVVSKDSLPFILTMTTFISQAQACFTWGNGTPSLFLDATRSGNNLLCRAVATNVDIFIESHHFEPGKDDRNSEPEMLCKLSVGSLGLMDPNNPDRPVMTRKHHRNTDFFDQGENFRAHMVDVDIRLPYKWAYHWNLDDRKALPIPADVNSAFSMNVVLQDFALEAPALQYTLPALLGGIMPLAKLIELPPIPTVAVMSMSIKTSIDLSFYLAEDLDSTYGSRAFYVDTALNLEYSTDALDSTELATARLFVSFGLCRLSRKSKNTSTHHLTRNASTVELKTKKMAKNWHKQTKTSFWKLNHKILAGLDFNLDWRYVPRLDGVGVITCTMTIKPIVMYLWVQDVALLFAVSANFLNDAFALKGQLEQVLAFELPALLRKETPEAEGGRGGRAPSQTRRSIRTYSDVGSGIDSTPESIPITHWLSMQDIVQISYTIPTVEKLFYDISEKELVFVLIVGKDDTPVLRFKCTVNSRLDLNQMDVGAQLNCEFFNSSKAGWEPVIEPWRLHGTVVFENLTKGVQSVEFKGAGLLAEEILEIDISDQFITEGVNVLLQGIRYVDSDSPGNMFTFYPTIDEDKKHQHAYELWNFTGETIYYQPVHDFEGIDSREAKHRDVTLDTEISWDITASFETIRTDERKELSFWERQGRTGAEAGRFVEDSMVMSNTSVLDRSWTKTSGVLSELGKKDKFKKRYIRIKFEEYDKSFESYLIRIDRVGDYAVKLGNGNILRVCIGTRNGLVKKIKLLSSVSIANRTGKDVWLSRVCDCNHIHQPLPVLKTMFCPIAMTDPNLDFFYTVQETEDFLRNQKSGRLNVQASDENITGKVHINIDKIPYLGETTILRVGNFMCAVEYEFLELGSMAYCNYIDDTDQGNITISRFKSYRPRWSTGLGKHFHSATYNKHRSEARMKRQQTLRAVQLVFKPLLSVVNELPIPLLVSSVYTVNTAEMDPKYVPPGGRFICEDTNVLAVQLKVPSMDTEWSLPIPVYSLAPPDIAMHLDQTDLHQLGGSSVLCARQENSRNMFSLADDVRIFNRNESTTAEKGYKDEEMDPPSLEEQGVGNIKSTSDLHEYKFNFRMPLAKRIHPSTILTDVSKYWVSVRVIETRLSQGSPNFESTGILNSNVPFQKMTFMFKNSVLATRAQKLAFNGESAYCVWEETLNFPFDDVLQKRSKIPKWLYFQYVLVPQSGVLARSASIVAASKVNLGRILFDFYIRGHRHCLRKKYRGVPMHRVDERHHVIDTDEVVGWVDFDVRTIFRDPNNTVRAAKGTMKNFQAVAEGDVEANYADKDDEMLADVEPNTDTEEFDVISNWGEESDEWSDSDLLDASSSDEEGVTGGGKRPSVASRFRRAINAQIFSRKIGGQVNQITQPDDHAMRELERLEEEEHVSYTDSRLLGRENYALHDFMQWEMLLRRHDSRRPPLWLNAQVTSARETGFRVSISADLWFVNDSTVPAAVQNTIDGNHYLHIVGPFENSLLEGQQDVYNVALKRAGELTSAVLSGPLESADTEFRFKDLVTGRQVLNTSKFAMVSKPEKRPFQLTQKVRITHATYISNETNHIVEFRPTGAARRFGTSTLPSGKTLVPWHFGCTQFQIRIRRKSNEDEELRALAQLQGNLTVDEVQTAAINASKEESFPVTDWCGVLDLDCEEFNETMAIVPVTLFDTDGSVVEVIRCVVRTDVEAGSKTRFVNVKNDEPPTYLISNNSRRTIVINQREASGPDDVFLACENVLKPGESASFGWTNPSETNKRIQVRMILTNSDKAQLHERFGRLGVLHDELQRSFKLDEVGKTRSVNLPGSQGALEMHGVVGVLGSSRHLRITCEKSMESGGDHNNHEHLGGTCHERPDDIKDRVEAFKHQYVVVVRVLAARNVGAPRGPPEGYPRVIVSCGPNQFTTPPGEASKTVNFAANNAPPQQTGPTQGAPVGEVKFVHQPFRFGFDITKPKYVRFELIQPIQARKGEAFRSDKLGLIRVPIRDDFYDTRDIAKKMPGWTRLETNVAAGNLLAELDFEIYLCSNMNSASLEVPRMLRIRLAGFGLSLINGRKRVEELYCRLTNVDVGLQYQEGRRLAGTVRLGRIQVDNNQPLVQNRVCIAPVHDDVPFMELFCVLNDVSIHTINIETIQVVTQSLIIRIDEKFLDALLGIMAGLIENIPELQVALDRAKTSVDGTFQGKRVTAYEFNEDMFAGETNIVVDNMSKNDSSESVHLYFSKKNQSGKDLLKEIGMLVEEYVNIYIQNLHIYPAKINLSFFFKFGEGDFLTQYQSPALAPVKGLLAGIGKWSDVVIRCRELHETDLFGSPKKLGSKIATRYALMLSKQVWKGIAALEIIGNPQHLLERLLGSMVVFSTMPVTEFKKNGIDAGFISTGDATASLMCTTVAAPVQYGARIIGSVATIFEGTRAVRHLGKPFRILTTGLEAVKNGAEFMDPLFETQLVIRKPRPFNKRGMYEIMVNEKRRKVEVKMGLTVTASKIPVDTESKREAPEDSRLPAVVEEEEDEDGEWGKEEVNSFADDNPDLPVQERTMNNPELVNPDVVIEVFDQQFIGLSEEAIEKNAASQFQINHQMHCCLLLIPGLNVVW